MGAIGCEHPMEASEIQSRRRHKRGQTRDEIQRLENHVGRPVTVRGFQGVADLAACGQEQALFGNGRTTDISAQSLELVALAGFDRHTGVQGEARHVSGTVSCPVLLIANRQGLEREHLAAPMRADGDSVGDGVAGQVGDRVILIEHFAQIELFGIALQ